MFGTPVAAYIQYCILKTCPTHLLYLAPRAVNSWQQAWLDQVEISQLSQANVDKDSEKYVGL